MLGAGATVTTALLSPLARASETSRSPVRRVMIVGSSMIVGALGRGLGDALTERGFEIDRRSRSASGLSRPDFHDWPKEARAAMREFRPDATVVMFGGNDAQGIWTRTDPKWIRFTEPAKWRVWYARRIAEFADIVTEGGQRLVWLGAPRMGSTELDKRMRLLNSLYAQQMAIRPNGLYVPTAAALAAPNGRYARALKIGKTMVDVRTHDGVHVTMAGARRVVEFVTPAVSEFLARPRLLEAPCEVGCLEPRQWR